MEKDYRIQKILFKKEEIESRIAEIAKWIETTYENSDEIVIIGVLKGAAVFLMELIKHINKIDVNIDFIIAKSYFGGSQSSGSLKIITDIDTDIKGKDVILLDDILDSGITLAKIRDHLLLKKPNSLKLIPLFNKKVEREHDVQIDYYGIEVPNQFLVGYGLDFDDKFRNWPFVAVFDPNAKKGNSNDKS